MNLASGSKEGIRMKAQFLKGTLFSIFLFISLLLISCGGGGGGDSPAAPSDTAAPSIPGSLNANAMSTGQIDLSWDVSTDNVGVTGYKIYRNGTYLTTVASNSRSETGLAKITSYCYRVSAVDAAGNESGQSIQDCATTLGSWTLQWGSTAADVASGMVRDSAGNSYVTGATFGSIDGQANAGGADAFLTKYNSSGVRQWTRFIGTTGEDRGQAVDVDSAGNNIYVTGYVSGSFDSKPYQGGKDVFLAKYNSSGTRLWYQQWGTATDNFGYGVKVDAAAAFVYVTGPTNEDLPGESSGNTIPNIFLSKRNAVDGSESLTILYGTKDYSDYVEGIALVGSDIYLTGSTTGAFPGYANNATYDVFLSRFNTSLVEQWTTQWGSTTHDLGHAVVVKGSNIYVAGSTSGSFGGQTNAGGEDIFLTEVTNTGVVQWTKFFGTTDIDRAYGIDIDGSDNIYLTGETFGALGGTNTGQNDVFLIKCDAAAAGNLLWARQLGTSAVDIGVRVKYDANDGYIYVTGYTSGNLDGNISAGGADVFLLKYDPSGTKQ
jgi:hypothetical protein